MSELSHHHSQPTPRWCSCAVPDEEVEHATSGVSRRNVLVGMSAAGVLAAAGWPGAANAAPGDTSVTITIMGTSDLHTNVVNWDYYKDATYSDSAGNAVGLARVASVVNQIRADRGREHTLLFDAGDTIQGTPLGFYYATVEPVTETGAIHPMAAQMNALGYDAVALGNHEFNYGLEFLDNWISQMDAPVLAANAVHAGTKVPRFRPYSITTMKVKGRPPIRVGVLGLTNPGRRHLGQGERLGQGRGAGARRGGRPLGARDACRGRRHRRRERPLGRQRHLLVLGRPARRERGGARRRAGARHRRDPLRARAPRCARSASSRTSRPASRSSSASRKNWGQRVSVFDLQLEFERGSWRVAQSRSMTREHEHGRRRPRVRGPGSRPARRGGDVHEHAGRELDRGDVGGRGLLEGHGHPRLRQRGADGDRRCGASPAPPRRRCRSSRSPRRSTALRASRPGRSRSRMSRGSTSTTTR